MIDLGQRLTLSRDVVIRSAAGVRVPGLQGMGEDEYILTRLSSRAPSMTLNRAVTEFLLSFSRPCSLASAVQLASRRMSVPAERVLQEIYPSLKALLARRVLIRNAARPRKAALSGFDGWRVLRRINEFDDTAVYLASDSRGRHGALKVARAPGAARMLAHERRVLTALGGSVAPALLHHGAQGGLPFLVSAWIPGFDAEEHFAELARQGADRATLLASIDALLECYQRLHGLGFLHGDVHPRNVIFGLGPEVRLIDFANAFHPDLRDAPGRMGVAFYFEPEYARSLAESDRTVAATVAGEIYALGALLHYLVSGVHYLEFLMERRALLRQIAEERPRPLRLRDGGPWPALERVIHRCLEKEPARRPGSLGELRGLIHRVGGPPAVGAGPGGEAPGVRLRPDVVGQLKAEFGLGSWRLADFDLDAPRCSLSYGAAGIAYALLRASQLARDSELLWSADAWIELADQRSREPEAFTSQALGVERSTIGYASVFSAEPGLHFVKSLVRAAQGDTAGTREAIRRFLRSVRHRRRRRRDVNLGGLGLALAARRLGPLAGDRGLRSELRAFGADLLEAATGATCSAARRERRLGFAHGLAGLVFTAVACGHDVDLQWAIEKLARRSEVMEKGVRWPVIHGRSYYMPGWCNGVAGHLLMWIELWRRRGRPQDLEMAERVAWGVWESRTRLASLCCGAAGQAVSLAVFARASGSRIWAARASRMLGSLSPRWAEHDAPQSLFRGRLGLLLARMECDAASEVRFPVFG